MQLFTHKNYTIVAETYETSSAWGHKATLLKTLDDDTTIELRSHKIRYYNRTWESYQYQSVIRGLLYDTMQFHIKRYIDDYKYINNIKRLSKKLKDDLTAKAMAQSFMVDFYDWYNTL
jgi:hypothetical protein